MILANWGDGAKVFFSILAFLLVVGITIFLYFSFMKERRNYRQEMAELMEGILPKNEITSFVNTHISKIPKDRSFALIYIDFDHFEDLVNAFGEDNGQKILDEAMRNVRKIFPTRVQIGRVGYDQFLILIKEDFDRPQTLSFANAIKEQSCKTIKVYNDTAINPTASIGVVFYPQHGRTMKELMKSIDIVMYTIKQKGGNLVSIYSPEMGQKESENLQYYYELKEAIKNKQFVLYYQPVFNIETNTIYGFEGLLRWRHPISGVLTPASFINILEQSGDINWIGAWGVETLIKEYLELKKQFVHKDLQLSLNLSPKELLNETLAVSFQRILKKYRIPAKNITIEVIEFAIFEKHEIVFKNIEKLKELGFRIAVDGFGIDQNTLAKLGQSPIDIIKLDSYYLFSEENSYIQNKYMELLIDFTKQTDRIVICEGIENLDNVAKVRKFGINLIQGYFISAPIPPENVIDYIKNEASILDRFDPNYQEKVEEVTIEETETPDSSETASSDEVADETKDKVKDKKKSKAGKDEKESSLLEAETTNEPEVSDEAKASSEAKASDEEVVINESVNETIAEATSELVKEEPVKEAKKAPAKKTDADKKKTPTKAKTTPKSQK